MTLHKHPTGLQHRRRSPTRSYLGRCRPAVTRTLPDAGTAKAAVRPVVPVSADWPQPGDPPSVPGAASTSPALRGTGAAGRAVSDAADRRGFGTGQMPGALPDG